MKKIFLIIILTLFKINFLLAENIEIINDTKGDGLKVVNHSWVKIEYTGSFEDGTVFDTNVGKDKPLVFQIGMKEVIPGFEQGIIGTNKGSKRKIKIANFIENLPNDSCILTGDFDRFFQTVRSFLNQELYVVEIAPR